jgi:hypothetical protein
MRAERRRYRGQHYVCPANRNRWKGYRVLSMMECDRSHKVLPIAHRSKPCIVGADKEILWRK